jgi:hypothetical protein
MIIVTKRKLIVENNKLIAYMNTYLRLIWKSSAQLFFFQFNKLNILR